MTWISIGEYFYRLYTVVLLILLAPIFSFVFLYVNTRTTLVDPPPWWITPSNSGAFIIVVLMLQFLIFNKKIKSIRKDQGLRLKLEKYFRLTIVRYTVIAVLCLALACEFYITNDNLATGFFAFNLVLAGILWPRSAKVCTDLKLRRDEREMVYFQKDYFRIL